MTTRIILSSKIIREAEAHLSKSDKIMAQLIKKNGSYLMENREYNPFHALTNSIIGQQLSTKAAATIRKRIHEIASNPYTPAGFMDAPLEALRSAGLSAAKAKYIIGLAEHITDGRIDFNSLHTHEDEEVIAVLSEISGIGRWTAEMFLIFSLKRPNVLSYGDAGLRRAVTLLYNKKTIPKSLAKKWSPYCSVASWHLWRYVDTLT